MKRTYRRSGALAIAAATVAIVAAGCGGSKSPAVASVATTTSKRAAQSTPSTVTGAGSQTGRQPAQPAPIEFSHCMRANGVPGFPDPAPGGGFAFRAGSGVDPSSPAFKAAMAKCRKFMDVGAGLAPGSTTHPSAQWLAHMLAVARCMRRHGVPGFPDPATRVPTDPFPAGGTGVISNIEGVILVFPSSIDMQSLLFTRAATECGFPLHNH